ncbi:MAG: 50S ribosomal protein L9 [Chthoniobacterales bacterium]
MSQSEVILTAHVPNLGAEADVVKVRRGYARNFLIPRGIAHEVTPATLRMTNSLKTRRAEREATELNEANDTAKRLGKLKLSFVLDTGEGGKAFGSVTAKDIADRLKAEAGHDIDRHRIVLERPIKETGDFTVNIRLHSDVHAALKLTVTSKNPPFGAAGRESDAEARPRSRRTARPDDAAQSEA